MGKLPKKKSYGGFTIEKIRLMLFGLWGVGKSTFASKFQNAVFIGTDRGLEGLDVYKKYISSWEEFLELVEEILDGDHNFQTVIIDTIDNLWKFCETYCRNKYNVDHQSELKWSKGWTLFRQEFEEPVLKLSISEYGLIFISHEKDKEISKKKIYTKTGPSLPNQAMGVVAPFIDIIGHCCVDEINDKERRFIEFEQTPYLEVKDRTGLMPARMPLRYAEFKKCFKNQKEKEREV